ncbi:hypothetical protein SAMN05444920_101598 [Nonomuraea solani]|uniref:Uncharacterized protein n=1 Tax=Nonomuraea solani TaxID=1144553 RepID=A0A1H5UPL8_9ACTN|nr:hypothetical protein [Nonomuraea solani]SEF76966.1 hypothetical protein SAMN05444920_101598 [Nonomuraea solani]
MAYESGSGRFCPRCGSHVGTLPQCPRCQAHQAAPGVRPHHQEPVARRRPAWRRPSVLISLFAAVLALAVTWWIVAGRGFAPAGSGSAGQVPPPASTDAGSVAATPARPVAQRQAERMEELLSSSSSTRSSLSDAIASATRCERDGVRSIRDITAGRREQLAAARALAVTALPSGTELKDALVDALDASHAADAAFLAWARRHVSADCAGPVAADRDYQAGLAKSETAHKAKTRFSRAWRPIAETYDLTLWKPDQI